MFIYIYLYTHKQTKSNFTLDMIFQITHTFCFVFFWVTMTTKIYIDILQEQFPCLIIIATSFKRKKKKKKKKGLIIIKLCMIMEKKNVQKGK